MDVIWIIAGFVFILAGLIGAVAPFIPGPPFSYMGLLFLQLTEVPPFSLSFLITWALIVIAVTFLENIASVIGARQMGGTRYGIWGCIAGIIIGFFIFPPFGIIIGPVIGAYGGEITGGKKPDIALKAAAGALLGFFVSTLLKAVVSLVLACYFVVNVYLILQ